MKTIKTLKVFRQFALFERGRTFGLLLVMAFIAMIGCSNKPSDSGDTSSASTNNNATQLQANFSFRVLNQDNSNTGMKLVAGNVYKFYLDVVSAPPGTVYTLKYTPVTVVGATTTTVAVNPGENNLSFLNSADYTVEVTATAPGMLSARVADTATVACSNPTFTAGSLNAAGIQVTQSTGQNLYNFNGASVVSSANGMAPYLCAWDPTGTGIVDTTFRDCSQTVSDVYVNYVATRNVGLIVKDACNTTFTVTRSVNLPFAVPAMPGHVFISGVASAATGKAVGDKRVDGVTYLATNQLTATEEFTPVQPQYNNGTFNINAMQDYQMPSSVRNGFGVKISVKGISGSLTTSAVSDTGITYAVFDTNATLSATNAYISLLEYITDQAGDSNPSVTYSSPSCVLSNQGVQVLFAQGVPCTRYRTGNSIKPTVEVWGHYVCTLTNAGGSFVFEGDFDGYDDLYDDCIGGGGGGGGGIAPIKL